MTANYIFGLTLKSAISRWQPFQLLLGWLLSSKILKTISAKASIWALLAHSSPAIRTASSWAVDMIRWAYLSIIVPLMEKTWSYRLIKLLAVPNRPETAGVC